ncbi:MAG: hypothetical protein ACE5Q6_12125 [Dehalococcoidia bacterium]
MVVSAARPQPVSRERQSDTLFDISVYGLNLQVSCNEPAFIHWLRYLLPGALFQPIAAPYADEGRATVEYQVHMGYTDPEDPEPNTVTRNGELIHRASARCHLQAFMERSITRELTRHVPPHHLVHAGAAVKDGHGILLPARSRSGKSTLLAALALSGFDYYSDEIAILTPEGRLLPFPKAATLRGPGWQALNARFPETKAFVYTPECEGKLRHLAAPSSTPTTLDRLACPVDIIAFPCYDPDQASSLQPLPTAMALGRLARQSLNLSLLGKPGMDALFNLVQNAQCYDFFTNDLAQAVSLLEEKLAQL